VQLSLEVSAGVKEQFTAVAAAHGLAFGELLERALDVEAHSSPNAGAGGEGRMKEVLTFIKRWTAELAKGEEE
jgi:hypothetical protein